MLRSIPPPLFVTNVPGGPVLKLGGFWPVVTSVAAAHHGVGTWVLDVGAQLALVGLQELGPGQGRPRASKLSWLSTQVAVSFPFRTHGCGALGLTPSPGARV